MPPRRLQQELDLNQRSLELLEERMKSSEAAQLAAALEATETEAAQAAEALEAAKQKQKEMRELAKVGRLPAGSGACLCSVLASESLKSLTRGHSFGA
jgi:hypothetical protein